MRAHTCGNAACRSGCWVAGAFYVGGSVRALRACTPKQAGVRKEETKRGCCKTVKSFLSLCASVCVCTEVQCCLCVRARVREKAKAGELRRRHRFPPSSSPSTIMELCACARNVKSSSNHRKRGGRGGGGRGPGRANAACQRAGGSSKRKHPAELCASCVCVRCVP